MCKKCHEHCEVEQMGVALLCVNVGRIYCLHSWQNLLLQGGTAGGEWQDSKPTALNRRGCRNGACPRQQASMLCWMAVPLRQHSISSPCLLLWRQARRQTRATALIYQAGGPKLALAGAHACKGHVSGSLCFWNTALHQCLQVKDKMSACNLYSCLQAVYANLGPARGLVPVS